MAQVHSDSEYTTKEGDFKNTPAKLKLMGGTHNLLIHEDSGEPFFNHEWHHTPTHIGNGIYAITKGCGWNTCYVKITENEARHVTWWERFKITKKIFGDRNGRYSMRKNNV